MDNSERSYSFHKGKIKFLLLEGIHPRARQILEEAGYSNIVEQAGALTPEALAKIPATTRTRILH
jgi:D-3-phosphoglycerate dehydrogenase